MTLQERMNAMKETFERTLSPEKRDIRYRATEDLRRSGILDRVIKVGAPIPEFTLPNARGEKVSSADLHSRGPLVMTFYRGVRRSYSNIELEALQESLHELKATAATLVSVSPTRAPHLRK